MAADPNFNLTGGGQPGITSYQPFLDPSISAGDFTGGGNSTGSALGNIAGPAAALGIGAYDIFKGNPDSAPVQALQGEAGQLGQESGQLLQEGHGLQSYLEQGTLDPGHQAQLELASNAAKARLIQGAASKGQNTNPMGNSGLTQDINSLGLQTASEKVAMEEKLFQSGQGLISEGNKALGMEVGIQETLAKIDQQQQADTTNAIMGFAKSLGSMDWGKIGTSLASLAPLAV